MNGIVIYGIESRLLSRWLPDGFPTAGSAPFVAVHCRTSPGGGDDAGPLAGKHTLLEE